MKTVLVIEWFLKVLSIDTLHDHPEKEKPEGNGIVYLILSS